MRAQQKFAAARSAGESFLGVEVSWDLGDHATSVAIPRERFEKLFIEAGAPPEMFQPAPTPENTLARASRIGWSQSTGVDARTISVKELSRPDVGTPLSIGVFYRVSVAGERDRWELGARARVSNDVVIVQPPPDFDHFPHAGAQLWAVKIADYANSRPAVAYNADVSEALVQFGAHLGWVSRRQSGGVYFLPGNLGERFMKVLDGLEMLTLDDKISFEGNSTPQYADPRTLQTWHRRTVSTFDEEIQKLTEKLKDMSSRENVRASSFDLRTAECALLMSRATEYAAILQDQLDPLQTAIRELTEKFGDAQTRLVEAKARGDKAFAGIQAMAENAAKKAKGRPVKTSPPPVTRMADKATLDKLFQV